jgi:ribosome biogenesis GTPase A
MGKVLERVRKVVKQSDVLLEVVDARFPARSKRLKRMARGKKLLLVQNKVDLFEGEVKEGIAFSAKTRRGKRQLMAALERLAQGGPIRVGVIGRPNVGKSRLINTLRGKKTAKTSSQAGYTRGEQWVRLTPNVLLIDSPGVITWDEPEDELLLQDALDIDRAKDPVSAALKLFARHPELPGRLELSGEGEDALKEFARKTGKLKKGGKPNVKEAARMIVRKWQRGAIPKRAKN